jgi:hypothetical protein
VPSPLRALPLRHRSYGLSPIKINDASGPFLLDAHQNGPTCAQFCGPIECAGMIRCGARSCVPRAAPLNQIQLMLGCFCCACGYVGNALALSTYPQAGPASHGAGRPLPEEGGQRRLATVPIDHDHPVRRMATTGSTDRRERATCKQPGPVNPARLDARVRGPATRSPPG